MLVTYRSFWKVMALAGLNSLSLPVYLIQSCAMGKKLENEVSYRKKMTDILVLRLSKQQML